MTDERALRKVNISIFSAKRNVNTVVELLILDLLTPERDTELPEFNLTLAA